VPNRISIRGQDSLIRLAERLEAMAERARDVSPAWRAWGDDVADAFTDQFRSEGTRLLKRTWSPLSPKYAAWKAKHFPGKTILRRTDVMMEHFTRRPLMVERIDAHSSAFGARGKVPKFHQRGTRYMPARPIARADDRLHAAASRHIRRHIFGRL
jgi:hypothetical protein